MAAKERTPPPQARGTLQATMPASTSGDRAPFIIERTRNWLHRRRGLVCLCPRVCHIDCGLRTVSLQRATMSIDFGRAPRGDPRMPHVSEKYFGVIFIAGQAVQLLAWGRGRVMGLTEVRPRRFDRDQLLSICSENKQKRQLASGKMPTHRLHAPDVKRGEKHGWGPAWFKQFHYNSWTDKRMGPSY